MAQNAHKIGPLMPATKLAETRAPSLRIADGGPSGFDPVGRLRADLDTALLPGGQDRWSPLGTSLFLLAVCGTFWVLVAMALFNGRH